jgi:Eukaryotic elongation factor 5A hypusine, DNA-binding OB fold
MSIWLKIMFVQVIDLSEDNFFSMMTEDGNTRDDLKITENCTPSTAEAVRELLTQAEASGERVIVSSTVFFI